MPMSSQRRTASRIWLYWGECCGCSCTPTRIGEATKPSFPLRVNGNLRGEHSAKDLDQSGRLIALHGVAGVGDDVGALESWRTLGERVGVLVVDEERVGASHQRRRHGDLVYVVPEAVEPVTLAERVVPPRPGAVVEAFGVV